MDGFVFHRKNSFTNKIAKRNTRQRFPPAWQGRAGLSALEISVEAYWPPLTPEHGFPSLPGPQGPLVWSGPDTGRSPSVRSRWSGTPVCALSLLREEFSKKQGGTPLSAPPSKVPYRLPTAALSASGKGSKRPLPLSLSAPLLFAPSIPPGENFVKGLANPGGKEYDRPTMKKGSPLARAERGP